MDRPRWRTGPADRITATPRPMRPWSCGSKRCAARQAPAPPHRRRGRAGRDRGVRGEGSALVTQAGDQPALGPRRHREQPPHGPSGSSPNARSPELLRPPRSTPGVGARSSQLAHVRRDTHAGGSAGTPRPAPMPPAAAVSRCPSGGSAAGTPSVGQLRGRVEAAGWPLCDSLGRRRWVEECRSGNWACEERTGYDRLRERSAGAV